MLMKTKLKMHIPTQNSISSQFLNLNQLKCFMSLHLLFLLVIIKSCEASYLQQASPQHSSPSSFLPAEVQAPTITPFAFNQNVQENQRSSVLCTISSGDLPVTISWLKDGQLLTPNLLQAKKIIIKPDSDQSTLKFNPVRLDHAGNYTCVAKNRAGVQAYSAQLIVHGEPRWLREPLNEPIVATHGQTIVIDCQTTGWPKPQQSWQIKTHSQNEFEPLAATGKISLAANGSLVIRNADKSDEANYRCRSSNGIGKEIKWSTSLKVTVPAHFELSNHATSTIVRKQSQVQLRCDARGDEPITIEWFKNKQRLTNELDARYSIHNKPLQNGLISLLLIKQTQRQDNSIYECVTRNHVGKDRLQIELIVQEEPDNIQELQVTQINSRSVTLMWTEPYDGRSSITSYMFQYKKVQDISSLSPSLSEMDFMDLDMSQQPKLQSQPPTTTADDWQQASRIVLPVVNGTNNNNGVKSITIEKLDPSTKYVLRALAINSIGQSKFCQPMEFLTEEEAPEIGPTNIKAIAINSTSIYVSWTGIPKSKQLGRIHGYYIGYRIATTNSSAQNFIYKPFIINDLLLQQQQQQQQQQSQSQQSDQRFEYTIHDLRRDTTYEITVVAFNSRGSGPASDFVLCKTIEMEAPKPVKLLIRRESNESIFIEWYRDPSDQNPVDDYVLYQEKNSASQEWLQLRLPGNQTQYKAPGLKCGTRYQFYIIAQNKVGKSGPSEVVSASTSGAVPMIPIKTSLIKMVNSTCLLVNLNSFQDNGCRIKTFTVRYKVEKLPVIMQATNNNGINNGVGATLMSSNGLAAQHQALTMTNQLGGKSSATSSSSSVVVGATGNGGVTATTSSSSLLSSSSSTPPPSEWITIRPKSNIKHQRANEEDRMEYLCDLNPLGEYTLHVAATNDVGRSEIEYTVLMSSDELRHSYLRDLIELIWQLPSFFAYIPSILVFLLAGLFLSLVSLILYTTIMKYYQKFVIMKNQFKATKRAKQDEKRRRRLNNSRHSQKHLDIWVDEYEEEEEEEEDVEDGNDEEDDAGSSSAASGNQVIPHRQFANPTVRGHYISNLANSTFDTSSIDTPCNKFGSHNSCMSTASTDSIHGRFQCLNSKQYVKMNEYSILPTISANITPPNDIYGTTRQSPAQVQPQSQTQSQSQSQANNSLYAYSTLRRSNMQTYLPQQQRQPTQAPPMRRMTSHGQNPTDIYGYYMTPPQANTQDAANEAANSIFVPPQQIIYSAPNIRRQPVFL